MSCPERPDWLEFEPPGNSDAAGWPDALARCCKFPNQLLQKADEARRLRAQLRQHERERVQVIRNLISVLDNCHDAAAAASGAAGEAGDSAEEAARASVQRSLVGLLEHLGVHSVELLGTTYETVTFQGTPIEDPFEVLECQDPGAVRCQPVREVVRPLWIQVDRGRIRMLRPGKVCC